MKGYRRLNETLGFDDLGFMSEFLEFKEMKDKHEFMIEEMPLDTPANIALYLAKQVLMEGVNLFGSFVMLLSFSQKGAAPGTVSVNRWSIVDESHHVDGLTALFKQYLAQHPEVVNNHFKAAIYEFARKVTQLEEAFIRLCYQAGDNPCLTADQAIDYVKMTCDYRMQQLGLKAQFGIKTNPAPWMDLITKNTLANFFETTVVEYSKNAMAGEWKYPELNEDALPAHYRKAKNLTSPSVFFDKSVIPSEGNPLVIKGSQVHDALQSILVSTNTLKESTSGYAFKGSLGGLGSISWANR